MAGLTRAQAKNVSTINARPAFGGTPSDDAVKAANADLHARRFAVVFYPFIMMDIPADTGRTLHDGTPQPAYPWHGRIACDPAASANPTGAWADHGGDIAIFEDTGWQFVQPRKGWRLWEEDTKALKVFDGTSWVSPQTKRNLPMACLWRATVL